MSFQERTSEEELHLFFRHFKDNLSRLFPDKLCKNKLSTCYVRWTMSEKMRQNN